MVHIVKEELRSVYQAGDEAAAREALAHFYDVADAAGLPQRDRLARTMRQYEAQLLAYYHSDGLSNARSESTNALIKKIKRVGHGFTNLTNYRLRLLLHCAGPTWHDPPAARIRGPAPRFAA